MGMATNLFVTTRPTIVNGILKSCTSELRKKGAINIRCETENFKNYLLSFTYNGEKRNMFVTTNCSEDYSDVYKGYKVIFSLGYWGSCGDIMKLISEPLKRFGGVYYNENDYENDDFVKL